MKYWIITKKNQCILRDDLTEAQIRDQYNTHLDSIVPANEMTNTVADKYKNLPIFRSITVDDVAGCGVSEIIAWINK